MCKSLGVLFRILQWHQELGWIENHVKGINICIVSQTLDIMLNGNYLIPKCKILCLTMELTQALTKFFENSCSSIWNYSFIEAK
jgi:hypothetical protein